MFIHVENKNPEKLFQRLKVLLIINDTFFNKVLHLFKLN